MIDKWHLSKEARAELLAVSADYKAMNLARREKRAEDEARNLLARAAGSNLSRRFDARPLTGWGAL